MLVLGDVNLDIIARVKSWPRPGEECLAQRVELHCGGVGANCALALGRWGVPVQLRACVGADPLGEFVLRRLAAGGIDVRPVQRTTAAMTGLLYINVTPDGQRTFFGSRGANCLARPRPNNAKLRDGTVAASLMGYSFLDPGPEKAARQVLQAMHARGGWVSLDVGMEPSQRIPRKILRMAKMVDLLFVSSDEATALTGSREPHEAFRKLQMAGVRSVVMKLGKRGCLIAEAGELRTVPPFSVRVVDSTGAGDAFAAAFLQARLRRWPVVEAGLVANAAGAAAAGVVGAGDGAPTIKQIAKLVRRQRLAGPWEQVRLRVLRRL
jgi:sugar/nucleoside kinase (ribokinase family)